MGSRMATTFHEGDLDSPDVRELLDYHFSSMRSNSPPEACHVLPADGLREAGVTFWSMREDGQLLGVGALRSSPPTMAK